MVQYRIEKTSKKAFLRWCAKGDADFQRIASYAVDSLLPVMEHEGFRWVERSLDDLKVPNFMIEMERRTDEGIECITYNFDKYQKYRFAITCTIAEPSRPFRRKVISRLVRYKSELDKARWWGASLLNFNKEKAFKKEVDKVSGLLPQLLDFLATGHIGANVYKFEDSSLHVPKEEEETE